MASNTPQRRSLGRPRPSLGNSAVTIASSPNLASSLATSQRPPLPNSQLSSQRPSAFSRKASYGQSPAAALSGRLDGKAQSSPPEEGGSSPLTMYPTKPSNNRRVSDDKNGNQNLEVGDIVDVPGSMHGTIKFLGEVNGKKGHFAGVELSKEFARMGKNNGDVDGWVFYDMIEACLVDLRWQDEVLYYIYQRRWHISSVEQSLQACLFRLNSSYAVHALSVSV